MDYLLFIFLCIATSFSPGPAVFLTIKNALICGVSKSFFGVLGNMTAMMLMASLSASVLGIIILTSNVLFIIV